MGVKSRGRGAAATFGLLLVLVGVAGAVVLWLMAERRPEQAVEGFARGPVGCTTTLEFADTGTFFVYAEIVGADSDAFTACEPVATPGAEFAAELRQYDRPLASRDDTSITYDTADGIGESVARVEIAETGRYELVVEGSDTTTVAAVGRDPQQGVDDLRRGAIVVGVLGVLLGGLMLLLAGRRSKRAATFGTPDGPGWAPAAPEGPPPVWPPEPPRVPQVPVDPMHPPQPAQADPEPVVVGPVPPEPVAPEPVTPEPVPAEPVAPEPASSDEVVAPDASPWAPPQAGERRDPPPPA